MSETQCADGVLGRLLLSGSTPSMLPTTTAPTNPAARPRAPAPPRRPSGTVRAPSEIACGAAFLASVRHRRSPRSYSHALQDGNGGSCADWSDQRVGAVHERWRPSLRSSYSTASMSRRPPFATPGKLLPRPAERGDSIIRQSLKAEASAQL